MNYYETMYIINSSLEGDEIQQIKKDVVDYMTSEGADIYSKSDWGRTRLAYDIEKQRYGNYIILRYSSKPELIRTLNEKFGLMDAVLSHLCIVLDKEPERVDEEMKAHEEKEIEKYPTTEKKIGKDVKVEEKADKKKEEVEEKAEEAAEEEEAVEEEKVVEKNEKDEKEEVEETVEEKEESA
ncbi:MAG: 30S ribosomal protein S6 [Candidatus Marinimicrobia bacterium]|nr:30S ribosomal protein S6 [Candidatus Neomarinimicrobiota bacterium]